MPHPGMQSIGNTRYYWFRTFFFVLLFGFVIRVFAFQYTFMINPDGEYYINQARALYYGQWENFTSCGLEYLSNYPIFITGAYPLFNDWIIAAKVVSLFFGTITLIPLYFLLKQFLDEHISALGMLIYALTPVFVGRSADVVKEPVFWFFLVLGLYGFVKQIDKKNHLYLLISSLSFIMATWTRIEAILFIAVSCIYILVTKQQNKITKFTVFILPVLVLLACILGAVLLGFSANDLNRVDELFYKFSDLITQYKKIQTGLKELTVQFRGDILALFLPEARRQVWFIAIGTLLNRALETFFLPFFLVFAIGISGFREKFKRDRRVAYLICLAISGLLLLYLMIMGTWVMEYRWLGVVIYPCSIFVGLGLEKIVRFIRSKLRINQQAALSLVCLLILISSLPKNLQARREDKLVFKQIGVFIAEREGNRQEIKISTSRATQLWISFYANMNYKGAPCPLLYQNSWDYFTNNYGQLIENLKQKKIKYFLWVEKHWPFKQFDFMNSQHHRDFKELESWRHTDTGRMVLFEMI